MKIIDGQKIADEILADLKKEIEKKGLKPCLGAILIGDDPASHLYLEKKEEAGQKIGLKIKKSILDNNISEEEILEAVNRFNQDKEIDGILVQMPLPDDISSDRVIKTIDADKDVDGFLSRSKFQSPLVLSIWRALKQTSQELKDKKVISLVNSDILGREIFLFFERHSIRAEWIKEPDSEKIKKADVLISVLGRPDFIKGSMIKRGAILIDGGIARKNGKIKGDVDRESVEEKAGWLSPTPKGLGPMTVAFLLKNVVLASQNE